MSNPQKLQLDSFDKSLEDAEQIIKDLIHKIRVKGKMDKTEFSQKTEVVRLVCNFHNYKTQNNYYLMAKAIKELNPGQQALLQQKLESL